eukprot:UN00483
MAQLEIPLTPDLVEKLQAAEGLSGDDIDFEALGIDVNAMADQLAEALQRGFTDSMRQSLETLDSVSWYHPGMLSFYFVILFLSYIVFKAKSNVPSIIGFIGVILFLILSDFLNLIFHDFNAQLFETTTSENIFDLAGLFLLLKSSHQFSSLGLSVLFVGFGIISHDFVKHHHHNKQNNNNMW